MFASLRLLSRRTLASQVSRVQSIAQAPVRQFSAQAAATKSGGWISGGGKWVSSVEKSFYYAKNSQDALLASNYGDPCWLCLCRLCCSVQQALEAGITPRRMIISAA